MSNRLKPYEGDFPDAQGEAEERTRQYVEEADGRLTSRQALAVLRVAVDAIEQLALKVEAIAQRLDDLEYR